MSITEKKLLHALLLAGALLAAAGCRPDSVARILSQEHKPSAATKPTPVPASELKPLPPGTPAALVKVVEAANDQINYTTGYDPAYVKLEYPGGDVPLDRGVCTDVIVRALRKAGVDLQKEVHEDMKANFGTYPRQWGLSGPDRNIDHRRVPNLMSFFDRKGKSIPVTDLAGDYRPGDIVTWDLGNAATHIGLVSNYWSTESRRYMIVHNIGGGARIEDVVFSWRVTGHYRYF
jgi:uncharacterized protein YijF (DUF1287 family)